MKNKQLQIAKDTIAKERNFKDWNDLNKGKIRVYNEEYIDQIAIEYHRLMSEWVSVDERLPEMGERVYIFTEENYIKDYCYEYEGCGSFYQNNYDKTYTTNDFPKVTHWFKQLHPPK